MINVGDKWHEKQRRPGLSIVHHRLCMFRWLRSIIRGRGEFVNTINRDTGESLTTSTELASANVLWMHPKAEMLAGAQG